MELWRQGPGLALLGRPTIGGLFEKAVGAV